MWKFLLICIIVGAMSAEGVRYRKRSSGGAYSGAGSYAGAGGSAGTYSGTGGYNGGYTGGYDDDFDYGYAPDFGFIDPYLFHQQLTAQILAQHNHIQNQIAAQNSYYNPASTLYAGSRYKPNRYASGSHNYAAAGGSLGPGGSYQTAYISPPNPAIPNISNRFGGPSTPGGYKGVSVSSYSSSSDLNGVKTGQRGAQTTINDNGKVTTYSVHS